MNQSHNVVQRHSILFQGHRIRAREFRAQCRSSDLGVDLPPEHEPDKVLQFSAEKKENHEKNLEYYKLVNMYKNN